VARRATIIKEVRSQSSNPVLVLDAGGTLFGQQLSIKTEGRVIVAAMNALGYDAMSVGSMDLFLGMTVLQERAQEADFEILSCNLVNAEDETLVFSPYTVIERDGVRFGVLGMTEGDLEFRLESDRELFRVIDPLTAVVKYLPELEEQSDVVILLSRFGLEEDRTLAANVTGIDIIIGGKSRHLLSVPFQVEDTVIMQAGFSGEWIVDLRVAFDEEWQVLGRQAEITTLSPEVEDDPELAALVAEYKERFPLPTPSQGG